MNSVLRASQADRWQLLADKVLEGRRLAADEAQAVLESSDLELLAVLAAAYRVRHHYFGDTVQFYYLTNAKSGLCAEDCGYCSQSKVSEAEIPRYNFLNREKLLEAAGRAAELEAKTYCLVISGRSPTGRELEAVTRIVPEIKQRFGLNVCACLGLLNAEQARRLKECGVDKVNHNLNTSRAFYPEICSTHTFEDRLNTLRAVREAGMQLCSGGIVGMGESNRDVVEMAITLAELKVESIPVNFLNPIEGTPLAGVRKLNPRYALKVLSMFRLVNPASEIRVAGGREMHLGSMQAMALYPANSVFVGDYLTTKGQPPQDDFRMVEELGFVVTREPKLPGSPAVPAANRPTG